ncbi:hypothetical protein TNCT_399401 [Trichonephila clavata]|uniref:Uncharacterized protein n=1 Tax=Trichonephila clavata TaxID=2740835 RepID=A0A8X6HHM9_TRICU|nr:hypothetical protein TNCT_399401 [Trichonephila clavata]
MDNSSSLRGVNRRRDGKHTLALMFTKQTETPSEEPASSWEAVKCLGLGKGWISLSLLVFFFLLGLFYSRRQEN